MTRRKPLLALALMACWVAPASAQSLARSRAAIPSTRHLPPKDKAWDTMNRYGVCIVATNPAAVKRALSQQGDAAIEAALAKIATDDCLSDGELTMSRPLFRGAIYRALYLRDFGNMSPESLAAPGSGNDQSGETADAFPMYIFSNCVVRLSADSARAFVMASPATPDENAAIAALRPALADCLPPRQEVHFTPWGLQASLSEALYKRTVALTEASKGSGVR